MNIFPSLCHSNLIRCRIFSFRSFFLSNILTCNIPTILDFSTNSYRIYNTKNTIIKNYYTIIFIIILTNIEWFLNKRFLYLNFFTNIVKYFYKYPNIENFIKRIRRKWSTLADNRQSSLKNFSSQGSPLPSQTRDPPPRTFQWKMFKLLFKLFPLKFLSTLPIVFSNASVVGKHSKYASSFCMSDVTQSRVPQKNRPARGTDGREWKYRMKLGESYPASLASLFSTRRVLFYRPVSRKSSTAGSPQGWRASTPRDIRHKNWKKTSAWI